MFVFPPPMHHIDFEPCGKAIEHSLMSVFMNSHHFNAVPCRKEHLKEVWGGAPQQDKANATASLEWWFVKCIGQDRQGNIPPLHSEKNCNNTLAGLTAELRSFTGQTERLPFRVRRGPGGEHRSGRKRLVPWSLGPSAPPTMYRCG